MFYVRTTQVRFPDESVAEGESILKQLNEIADQYPGHIAGMIFRHTLEKNRYLRISVWENRAQADAVSRTDKVIALRSRLDTLAELSDDELHSEQTFEVVDYLMQGRRPPITTT